MKWAVTIVCFLLPLGNVDKKKQIDKNQNKNEKKKLYGKNKTKHFKAFPADN